MSQYRPVHQAGRLPILSRGVRPGEVQSALSLARAAGLRNLLVDGRPAEPAIAHPPGSATVRR